MPELNLILSDRFALDDANAVRTALSEHLSVGEPRFWLRKSVDPTLISIIQLMGTAAAWLPLSAAATIYLSTLAKRAGDATWDGIASLLKRKEVKPLADVATTLATTASKMEGKVEIVVGLSLPDDSFGAAVTIKGKSPEDVAQAVAAFVVHVEALSKTMQAEVEAGRAPLRRAAVEVQGDGSLLVKWYSHDESEEHERRIP
ncbi:MAG: hypothetical protein RIB84_27745 [Sneathiellaceae bacterium]